ncbi:hypothetical protein [Delftia acidovorans]|uniref:hypothetical protein n=1 Tax=Delftia acidovorans TaxID=80866 RepID=UPI001ED966B6|nr:hypothetical protein [Delftia acidovorans]
MLADAPHGFVFKHAGDAMDVLGFAPFDEATVIWTWVRAEQDEIDMSLLKYSEMRMGLLG